MTSSLRTFFLENNAWLIGIGGALSLIGAILAGIQQGIEAKASNKLLKETNNTVAYNKQLTENIQTISTSNQVLTNNLLELNGSIQGLSEKNLEMVEKVNEISTFNRDYLTGRDSYCKIIHLVKGDTATLFLANAGQHPIRDLEGKLDYEELGVRKEFFISISVLYPMFEKKLKTIKLDVHKVEKIVMILHSMLGFKHNYYT